MVFLIGIAIGIAIGTGYAGYLIKRMKQVAKQTQFN